MSAEAVARALGAAHRSGAWWRARCPVHRSNGATLALRDGSSGFIVLHCHGGCPREEVVAELARLGLFGESTFRAEAVDPVAMQRRLKAEARDRQRRIDQALLFWRHETADPHGTVVERYWFSRGLPLPIPATIRASRRRLPHPEGGYWPMMIALVIHVDHGPVAVHRTWLAADGGGKAPLRQPRMTLGPIAGAAVQLARASERGALVIAEGIETAASMMAAGLPAWAAICADGIKSLVLPPRPTTPAIIIAADHDRNGVGERAARDAAQWWVADGRRVWIALPPVPGTDWNDVLLNKDIQQGANHAA